MNNQLEQLKEEIRQKPYYMKSKLAKKYNTTYATVRYWHWKIHRPENAYGKERRQRNKKNYDIS